MNIHVDTLEYANDLQKAGIERAHAEAIARLQARTVGDLVEHELVTKDNLRSELAQLEARLRAEMSQLEGRLKTEITQGQSKLRDEMSQGEARLKTEITQGQSRLRDEMSQGEARLREEIRTESTAQRRHTDALMIQIRALQLGGAIAAFALGAIVLMARLIR